MIPLSASALSRKTKSMANKNTVRLLIPEDEPRLNVAWTGPEWPRSAKGDGLRIATTFELSAPLRRVLAAARQSLCNLQCDDGHFADAAHPSARCSAEILLAAYWLGDFDDDLMDRLVDELLDLQLTSGGWSYRNGQSAHAGTSLLAYLALKLSGLSADTESMTAARRFLIAAGGIEAADLWSRRYLALFGQLPFSACRSQDPHDLGNRDAEKAWATLEKRRAVRQFSARQGIGELLLSSPNDWRNEYRSRGLRGAVKQIAECFDNFTIATSQRQDYTDPHDDSDSIRRWRATLWTAFAANASAPTARRDPSASRLARLKDHLGQSPGSPSALLGSDLPPATATAIAALAAAGLSRRSAPLRHAIAAMNTWAPNTPLNAADMLSALCRLTKGGSIGDEVVPPELQIMQLETSTQARPSDSDFENRDTCDGMPVEHDCNRLSTWLTACQMRDGSWEDSAYTTARVITALSEHGLKTGNRSIDRAVRFLRATQQSDGSWSGVVPGRRRENDTAMASVPGAIATTARALAALSSAGLAMQYPAIVKAVNPYIGNKMKE